MREIENDFGEITSKRSLVLCYLSPGVLFLVLLPANASHDSVTGGQNYGNYVLGWELTDHGEYMPF